MYLYSNLQFTLSSRSFSIFFFSWGQKQIPLGKQGRIMAPVCIYFMPARANIGIPSHIQYPVVVGKYLSEFVYIGECLTWIKLSSHYVYFFQNKIIIAIELINCIFIKKVYSIKLHIELGIFLFVSFLPIKIVDKCECVTLICFLGFDHYMKMEPNQRWRH